MINKMNELKSDIETATTPDMLRGVEGQIRKQYYQAFNDILKEGFQFSGRSFQPPENEVNALISFGNSVLYATTLTEIYKTHLNPTISYLHEPRERRFSLSLDLSEVFKPVIVDRVIFSLVNKRQISLNDFRSEVNGCLLTEDSRKTFLKAYENRLETTIEHPTLDKYVSHQRLLRLEAYKLVKHVSGDDQYNGYRMPSRK